MTGADVDAGVGVAAEADLDVDDIEGGVNSGPSAGSSASVGSGGKSTTLLLASGIVSMSVYCPRT